MWTAAPAAASSSPVENRKSGTVRSSRIGDYAEQEQNERTHGPSSGHAHGLCLVRGQPTLGSCSPKGTMSSPFRVPRPHHCDLKHQTSDLGTGTAGLDATRPFCLEAPREPRSGGLLCLTEHWPGSASVGPTEPRV